MKDIFVCPPTNLMAKVGVAKKKDTVAKRQKVARSSNKVEKISKSAVKKPKTRKKDIPKKKSEKKTLITKKNEDKKESKKKVVKEPKSDKVVKNSQTDVSRKRKLTQKKTHAPKSNRDHAPPMKTPKLLSASCDTGKLLNGNFPTVSPQTTRNPWVLKLDIPPQPKPVTNGVQSNGTLALCNKSVIFIPKNNAVSGVILKRGTPLPLQKEGSCSDKMPHTSRSATGKVCANVNKLVLKNGFESCSSSPMSLKVKKKVDICKPLVKKDSPDIFVKETKYVNGQKQSTSKTPNHISQDQKVLNKLCAKKKNEFFTKDQKPIFTEVKPISVQSVNEKPTACKPKVCLSSKSSKLELAKNQKVVGKETKASGSRAKKPVVQESKALCLRNQTKIHPQRMASLDAMAKMHVICSTDRRLPIEVAKSAVEKNNESNAHTKTNTKKIHVGIKKEMKEIKGRVIRSQINCVKFEESSVSGGTENVRTFCSFSQEQEQTISKRPRGRPRSKPIIEVTEEKHSFKFNDVKRRASKNNSKETNQKHTEKKVTKSTRVQRTVTLENSSRKAKKNEPDTKLGRGRNQKTKIENKSKVKVKETIRMRKTCTYQSVTTVSSHKEVNSVVSACRRLGVTTNYETKKTVVRDRACEEKTNLRLEELQESFMPSLESPVQHLSNFCNHAIHSPPHTVIPIAHSQPCHRNNGAEKASTSQARCCDGGFSVHRCNHKEPVAYHHVMHDCGCNYSGRNCCKSNGNGCCCSNSILQPIRDACVLSSESNTCAHNSYCHFNPVRYPSCSCCHSIPSSDQERSCNLPSTSNFQNRWCACRESCHSSSQLCPRVSCTSCPSATQKQCAPSVPFDQIPLDLSLGSPSSYSAEKSTEQSRTVCQTRHCCRGHSRFQPFSHNYQCNHQCNYVPNHYSSCWNKNSHCKEQEISRGLHTSIIDSHHTPDPMPILASISSYSNDESSSTDLICQEISTIHNYACSSTKKECSSLTRVSITKKKKFAHGWSWEGEAVEKMIALTNDSIPAPKMCYPALRHKEGDIIKERDCVLLKSGPKDTDLPYVAKVAAFWENEDDGEMMMSLLWYYRPEHTDQGRRSGQMDDEVFASKHRDVNSVACIEDKCFVLTYNEYCRHKANLAMMGVTSASKRSLTVPEQDLVYPRQQRLPNECVSHDMIFFCRHVYDFRQKRILKNPT